MRHHQHIVLVVLLCLALSSTGNLLQPEDSSAQAAWNPPTTVYIPSTGHTIDGLFFDVWRDWGSEQLLGLPLTEELTESDHTVQYFDYARLEYWPEGDHEGRQVHLGDIGAELLQVQLDALKSDKHEVHSPLVDAAGPIDPAALDSVNTDKRFIETTKHTVQLGFRDIWESTGEASFLGNPLTEEYWFGDRVYQFFERGQLFWDSKLGSFKVQVGRSIAEAHKLDFNPVPQGDVPSYSEALFSPPAPPTPLSDPNAERWIEVNLSWQYLIAWQGDVSVLESYVSTGKAGFETPTGNFSILSKLELQDMEGTIGGEYYNVPGVPWVMYFTEYGHALHGTYWHDNFGTPMSHGCVNLPLGVAEWLYYWASIGTRVAIHY